MHFLLDLFFSFVGVRADSGECSANTSPIG
jgi:hypothetical protein